MSVSIMFKGLNCLYYGNLLDLLFEFVPQLILFVSIFGYMVFCIVMKWAQSWDDNPPPEIINLFTNIVINVDKPLWNDPVQQLYIQRVLVQIALICVPIMLFPKPIINHNLTKAKLERIKQKQKKESEKSQIYRC